MGLSGRRDSRSPGLGVSISRGLEPTAGQYHQQQSGLQGDLGANYAGNESRLLLSKPAALLGTSNGGVSDEVGSIASATHGRQDLVKCGNWFSKR